MSLIAVLRDAILLHLSSPLNVLTFAGATVLLSAAIRYTTSAWKHFRVFVLARQFPHLFGPNLRAMGSWAVVTGASDGIGKEYAKQLANIHRLNVVLISRSLHKLEKVAAEIEASSPQVKTKCLAIDFSNGLDIYDTIETAINSLDIAILVNNVGDPGRLEDYVFFHETKRNRSFLDMIHVNCGAATFMTQMVLPRMVVKRKGVIVNVSSAAGYHEGLPRGSIYAGAKAYVIRFTRTLEVECFGSGVIFQTLTPYMVATKMIGQQSSFVLSDTKSCVQSSIAAIGVQSVTCGTFVHTLLDSLMMPLHNLPTLLVRPAVMYFSDEIGRGRIADEQKAKAHSKDN